MTCQLVLLLDTRRIEFEMPEDGLLEGSWSGLEGARSLGRNGTHDEHRDFRRYADPGSIEWPRIRSFLFIGTPPTTDT